MHTAQPLTISSELLTEIELLGATDERPSAFASARLKREANKLMQVNALEAYVVMAGTAALEWRAADVIDNTEKALRLSRDEATYTNCALSLRFVGEMERSANLMAEAAEKHPLSLAALNTAVDMLVGVGRLRSAAEICQGMVNRSMPLPGFVEATAILAAKADRLGVSDDAMAAEASLAFQVLKKHCRRIREYSVGVVPDPDGTETLVSTIQFIGSARDEIRLESELALLLADLPTWNPSAFAIELSAVSPQHANLPV